MCIPDDSPSLRKQYLNKMVIEYRNDMKDKIIDEVCRAQYGDIENIFSVCILIFEKQRALTVSHRKSHEPTSD